MPWPRWCPPPVAVVAESLRRLADPALAGWRRLPPAGPRAVVASIARSLAPAQAADSPPPWLRPGQIECYRRALAAIRHYRGALIAEPAGIGKTWVALAVARTLEGSAACVVPAVLREQWEVAARTAGVPISVTSHEEWSRGPRTLGPGLVIVDESHRFRTDGIRRLLHLAPAVVGRSGLLLTATPVVNRLQDLATQLLLFVREDALAPAGVPSLKAALARDAVPHALAGLVIGGTTTSEARPGAVWRDLPAYQGQEAEVAKVITALRRLRLSPARPVRRLLRGVFLAALASSPAAILATLERYRLLLLQRRDAGAAGRHLARAELRRLLSGDLEQLVFWPLVATEESGDDLAPDDLVRLETVRRALETLGAVDAKLDLLRGVLADGMPTVVFAGFRSTVEYLRRRLHPPSRVAWCTGNDAGIGPARLSRPQVLRWFRPGARRGAELGPTVLVTTDVAAEGLDLQRAGRVVHYDLPWTPMRLEQRAGRTRRLGSDHATVEITRFVPPLLLEQPLRVLRALTRKAELPYRLGLGGETEPGWAWRAEVATRFAGEPAAPGIARAVSRRFRLLVGIELVAADRLLASTALAQDRSGRWHDGLAELNAGFESPPEVGRPGALSSSERHAADRAIERLLRRLRREAAGSLWGLRPREPGLSDLLDRLHRLAANAARARDRGGLARIDAAVAFLRRGHTTGERLLAQRLATATDEELRAGRACLPAADSIAPPIRVRFTGVVFFDPPNAVATTSSADVG